VLSFSHTLWLSLLVLLVTGFAMVSQMAASNTIVQTIVDEDKRGRVMSFYAMAFVGMAPLGSLLSGCLASRIGTMATIMAFGLISVTGSLVFASLLPGLRRIVHPIYAKAGLLPDSALQDQATAIELRESPEYPAIIPLRPAAAQTPAARRSAA
jgi:MFS family permease